MDGYIYDYIVWFVATFLDGWMEWIYLMICSSEERGGGFLKLWALDRLANRSTVFLYEFTARHSSKPASEE